MESVTVAVVRRAHALEGALLVRVETDFPRETFRVGRVFRVAGRGPVGLSRTLTLTRARPHGNGWLLDFREIGDRTLAERYRGVSLTLERGELVAPRENEYFLHDLPGLEVRDEEGRRLGQVSGVYETGGAAPVLGVRVEGTERLVPLVREFVVEVEPEEGFLRLRPPAGLLEL